MPDQEYPVDGHITITDMDGDALTVRYVGDAFTACIAGEDGHRTVYLTRADIGTLVDFVTGTRSGEVA